MRPVELVGLARRKAQRHKGCRRRRPARDPPGPRVAAERVVAALVTETAQFFEGPNQRQPLARRPRFVRQQQRVELLPPRVDPRQRLPAPLITEFCRLRADHLAHDLARQMKLAADRLDRLLLQEIGPTYLCNRLHDQHPPLGSPGPPREATVNPPLGGPFWMPISP